MKRADQPPTHKEEKKLKDVPSGTVIALQLLDTSWRVTLPILGFTYLGIRLDRHNGTSPLYTLIGLFLSLALSTLLVYKQVKYLYPDFFKQMRDKK